MSSYSSYIGTGQPGTVIANHDGPLWNRRWNYRRKGKRGYVHVAHLRRVAKKEARKQARAQGRRAAAEVDT
jgi:hypothetical protein